MHQENVLNSIKDNFVHLSKGQRRIANYIFEEYDKAAYMTASAISNAVGVSESTVVRFAMALGYDGYPDLQKALQESIKTKLTAVQRFDMSKNMNYDNETIKKIMTQDADNIRKTINMIDQSQFESVIDTISSANKTFLMGNRSSAILANYLGFYLHFIVEDLHIIPSGTHSSFDELINIDSNDCLIVVSFPRYAKGTLDAVNFAKSQGAKIIGITDSVNSPIHGVVDYVVYALYNMNTFIDSMVAPMSLINAIIMMLSLHEKNKDRVQSNFKKLEALWQRYDIYNPNDDEAEE